MKLGIISFTNNGLELSKRVAESLMENTGIATSVYTKCSLVKTHDTKTNAVFVEKSIADWTKEQMQEKNSILFIGACGIAVRAIAPNLTDKLHDSPVLVLDEQGQIVTQLLAGLWQGQMNCGADCRKDSCSSCHYHSNRSAKQICRGSVCKKERTSHHK